MTSGHLGAGRFERARAGADHGRLVDARGEHGVDRIGGRPASRKIAPGAGDEEVDDLGAHGRASKATPWSAKAARRHVDRGAQRRGQPFVEHVDDADRAAAQSEGIAQPVGPCPTLNRPHTVSSLSAKAVSLPTRVSGAASPAKRGW